MKIIVVGGGWGGITAAYQASKYNTEVTLVERTDMLLGSGLVGGIMRNNGRFTGLEEIKYMGLQELVDIIDNCCIHKNIDFPNHKHASFYDVLNIEKEITQLLLKNNVRIKYYTRIVKVNMENNKIKSIVADNNELITGDIFIDATGTAGPANNCTKYGNGCVSCIYRCSSFGGRVSLTGLCGIDEKNGIRKDGAIGSMSGSCKILKKSLSKQLASELKRNGLAIIPLKKNEIENKLDIKVCQQYASSEYRDNIILLDNGEVKLMAPYYSLTDIRNIEGFEKARYIDPYSGGIGNSMRFFSLAPHTNDLKVIGVDNLFCCGEKANLVGHTEAIITGALAGYNAVKLALNQSLLILPVETAIGISIINSNKNIYTEKYTLSGSILFEDLKREKLYTTDVNIIENRIIKNNLYNILK
jgi:hypothetical protein